MKAITVRVLVASALLLASPWGTFAQSANELAQQVVDTEHAFAAAFQSCDPDALDKLTTEDITFTDYNGMTYSRHWLMTQAEACSRGVVRLEPMRVTLNDGDNSAIVQSRYHQFVDDEPLPVNLLTHVLIRRDGVWRVALHHSNVMMKSGSLGNQYKLPNSGEAFRPESWWGAVDSHLAGVRTRGRSVRWRPFQERYREPDYAGEAGSRQDLGVRQRVPELSDCRPPRYSEPDLPH